MPRPPITGDESGEDCSAKVEWCKFVHALEKSKPRDRRGRTDPGDVYGPEVSGLGDRGMGLVMFAVLVLLRSLVGICKLRPRGAKLGLRGVTGVGTWISSLDVLPDS